MTRLSYSSLSNLNGASAVASINANFAAVQTELEKALYRDGTATNSMTADLDMNSNNILNLPAAATSTEPVRKAEFDALDAEFDALETSINASIAAINSLITDLNADVDAIDASVAAAAASAAAAEAILALARFSSYAEGVPTASEEMFRFVIADSITIPASLTGSLGDAATAATAETVFSVQKNDVEFGTLTFAASGTTATAAGDETSLVAGDILSVLAPASPDATLGDVSITIAGTRT